MPIVRKGGKERRKKRGREVLNVTDWNKGGTIYLIKIPDLFKKFLIYFYILFTFFTNLI